LYIIKNKTMAKKKYEQSIFKEVVDRETGEIVSVEQTKIFTKTLKSETFYMTFIDYVSPLFNLKSEVAKSILTWMCTRAEYNTGRVLLPTNERVRLCDLLDISNNALTNNLALLKKNNLISGEKGEFIINPQIHWKGDTQTRDRLLKDSNIKITFSIETE